MRQCPICKSMCFDDMETCFGCLYQFGKNSDYVSVSELKGSSKLKGDEGESDDYSSEVQPWEEEGVSTGEARVEATLEAPIELSDADKPTASQSIVFKDGEAQEFLVQVSIKKL